MFHNREDAGLSLAEKLKGRPLREPIVLAIPRGGVVLGAVLARELGADLDVVLARKLRAPGNPELAIGAIGEDGSVYLDPELRDALVGWEDYLAAEIATQKQMIAQRKEMFRGGQPAPCVDGRSVIVTDDGIATGATMLAALQVLAGQRPHEVIVAVPVGSPDRLAEMRSHCSELVCLLAPANLRAIGQFYRDFRQVEDDEVAALLAAHSAPAGR